MLKTAAMLASWRARGLRRRVRPVRPTRKQLGIFSLGLWLTTVLACVSPPPPELPPLTPEPTENVSPGKFVWIDLITQDVAASRAFYGALFGWTFRDGDRYTEVLQGDRTIAGIVVARDPQQGSEWVGSLSVRDVDRAAELFAARGGTIERGPVDAPHRGRLALVSDKEGALVLLVRSGTGDPADREPEIGHWLWRELWSQDPVPAAEFYRELAGYEVEIVDINGLAYHVLRTDEMPRGAVVAAPEGVPPLWLPYVRVSDASAIAKQAEVLGARVVMEHDQAAILVDPTGAAFAVQEWEPRVGAAADTSGNAGDER